VLLIDRNERWRFAPANILGSIATVGKRTAGRQVRQIGRIARYPIPFAGVIVSGLDDAL
jgi:hypothetical protein